MLVNIKTSCHLWVWNLVTNIKRRKRDTEMREVNVEKNVWTSYVERVVEIKKQ